MTEQMKLGYKMTDVGVIPEDWDLTPLGKLVISVDYGTSAKSSPDGRVPVLRMGNLQGGKIDWSDLVFTDDESEIAKYSLRHGDVLFNRTNTIDLVGKTSIYQGEQPAVFAGYLIRINVVLHRLDSRFLNYVLNTEFARKHSAKILSVAVSQANINGQKLKTYPIPLPPTLAEQEAIAGALSDAVRLIESLEQLVAKKRWVKQGAMQELLTGQKRLAGYTGKWEVTTLGELTTFLSGGTPSRSNQDYWTGDIPWISATSLRCFEIWRSDSNVTKDAVAAGSKMAPVGSSLLLVRGSALHNEILCGLVTRPVCFNQDVKALVPNSQVIPRFLTFFVKGAAEKLLKLVSSAGNTAGVLDTKLLKAFRVNLPNPAEQTAIVAILSDMDAEIAGLEAKLVKARQVKQGMMQELLTGRIRLVQPSPTILPFPEKQQASNVKAKGHNEQFNEAVVLAVLSNRFGSEQYPLGRLRRTKLSYLLHRNVERVAEGFQKKAAGPYNPQIRYGGAEKIALKNGYVLERSNDKYDGFVAAEKIAEAESYFEKWYGTDVLEWLEQFRFKKNDDLELLTTVDMAVEDLRKEGKPANLASVKQILRDHPEWKAKLERAVFSDANIQQAILSCSQLFSPTGNEQ